MLPDSKRLSPSRNRPPTGNADERTLRQSVIQCKISALQSNSRCVQSRQGTICHSSLLTVTTSPRQQGSDFQQFLEKA
jgi:hypothetical protein